jgi:cystathionine beta-lyase family protein involved in aluminum resistance
MFLRAARVEKDVREVFDRIDEIAQKNTIRVMEAFQDHRVTEACFAGTTGYGYDDMGRDVLDKVYAQVFGAEAAHVRIGFVNGTHTISTALFSAVKPGDTLMCVTGLPYDTMRSVIGIAGDEYGSLKFYGVGYDQVDLTPDGEPDYEGIAAPVAK